MAKKFFEFIAAFFCFFLLAGISVFAQDLSIGPEDIRIDQWDDGGFHLYIRKKPDVGSVMLIESTRDPSMGAHNFAFRSPEWNSVNGDEIRVLNGAPIPRESQIYSLIDSTPEADQEMGEVFHIFIPWTVYYGYENGRHGEIRMSNGVYLNIRAFRLPYGDYRNVFVDNPFTLAAVQRPPETFDGDYMREAEEAFSEIAEDTRGAFTYAADPAELVGKIGDILRNATGRSVDLVFCLDTTVSMRPYVDQIREMLVPMMQETIARFESFRIGIVLYKDYYDEYLNKIHPFTADFNLFQRNLNGIRVRGGGDIPEAIYEALYEGATKFPWAAETRLLILAGDAPPHPVQRGRISRAMAYKELEDRGVKVDAIILSR